MAKPAKQLKRTIDAQGKARYFYGGKRISDKSGRTKFVRTNYQQLKTEPKQLRRLTDQERTTFAKAHAQRQLDRFKGRPVNKIISYVFRDILKAIGPDPVDFNKILNKEGKPIFKNYGDLLRRVDFAEQAFPLKFSIFTGSGMPGWRGRERITSVTDIVEKFNDGIFKLFNIRVRFPEFIENGADVSGRASGFSSIMRFETTVIASVMESDRENVSFVQFEYFPEYDFVNKLATFDLRLKPGQDADIAESGRDFADVEYIGARVNVMTSDPKQRNKSKKK